MVEIGSAMKGEKSRLKSGLPSFLMLVVAAAPLVGDNRGQEFVPVIPACRALDTRTGAGIPLVSGTSILVDLSAACGLPLPGYAPVAITLTLVEPMQDGYVTVYPDFTEPPSTSNINASAGTPAIATAAIVSTFNGGLRAFYGTAAFGTAHLIVDVTGYFRVRSTIHLGLGGVNPNTGEVVINGFDVQQANGIPFDIDWGDGSRTLGFFPQSHAYADRTRGYRIVVTSFYYSSGGVTGAWGDTADIFVSFPGR